MPEQQEFSTVILRFRDLVTAEHETIRLHQEIIQDRGFVWWGWWSKTGETVPDGAFRSLNASASAARGLEVLLLDSGAGRLYCARCTEVRWDLNHTRIGSPDDAATPAYYGKQRYLAWFKLAEIQPVTEASADEELKRLTYVRVDDFFESGASLYGGFYDKQVHSTAELRQQERTIWFVRPFREGDCTHELQLLDSYRVSPSDFPRDFLQSPSRTLLWVSDPHFAPDTHHAFPLKSNASRKDLGHAIEDACQDAGIGEVAGVLVSGDLTWRAAAGEFEAAKAFLARLGSCFKLKHYVYAVCPGNHDLRFSADPALKGGPVTVAAANAVAEYARFYQARFYKAPHEFLCCGRRFLLANSIPVEVALLNSSLLQQSPGSFQGHGFVGDPQLRHVAQEMGWNKPAEGGRAFRVLVVHHHLLPVTFREDPVDGRLYSIALDAEAIMRWIVKHRVDVVLHGHMHQPFYVTITRPETPQAGTPHTFAVFGAGSAGVEASHLGEPRRNMFATLTFSSEAVTVTARSVDSANPSEELWSVRHPVKRS